MPENNQALKIVILDTDFKIKGGSNPEKIQKIAEYVQNELETIKQQNQYVNHIRIAILGCMNITERYFDLQGKLKSYQKEYDEELQHYKELEAELKTRQDDIEKVKRDCADKITSLHEQWQTEVNTAKEQHEAKMTSLQQQYDSETSAMKQQYETELNTLKTQNAELATKSKTSQADLDTKNELLNQYREKLTQSKDENDVNRKTILDLQNQLFENQIELAKLQKQVEDSQSAVNNI